ncbi:MAG: hypothetical protein LBL04_17510 [Bacteroidales bacterium]|jgi:hypothetical protein|nr:hypothetical protein [Bacteroidales bacterium]
MSEKVTKFDQTADAASWAGLVILWVAAAFFEFILHRNPGEAIGSGADGPVPVYFAKPILQIAPAIVCTVVFLILTVIMRIDPASVSSRVFRYLRLASAAVALILYGCMYCSYVSLLD